MATCSASELVAAAKCFGVLDQWQLELVKTSLLCQILQLNDPMATCNVQELLNDANCFACLSQKDLEVIQTQLLCEILQAGGTGGQSCNLCGTADPTDDPTCDCATYYRTDTGEFWVWDDTGGDWVKILSNT